MTLQLHNTLTKTTEPFVPLSNDKVLLYTCGPTVYNYLHVGNWAAYIYWDVLTRTLKANGYTLERVMNITDVGHLVSDSDDGEDKLQKGARREGKTAWEVAEFYAEDFLAGMEKLGMLLPEHIVKATDFIPQQLELIRILKEKGYTYQIDDGIYFDTALFPSYADFARLNLEAQQAGARVEFNQQKRNLSDFALWKFTASDEKRDMQWETPTDLLDSSWNEMNNNERAESADNIPPTMGFPGWHLECSAMAMSILGPTLDIHTGGIDHIPVHHTNEIAQSESASGKIFSRYWLHNNHLKVDGTKISKSLNNGFTLQDLAKRGFSPLDYRMFILQSHYSSEGNFTFDNLTAAKNRLNHWRSVAVLRHQTYDTLDDDDKKSRSNKTVSLLASSQTVIEALNDNLNTSQALTIVDEAFSLLDTKSLTDVHQFGLNELLDTIDTALGLQLRISTPDIDDEAKRMILKRQSAREEKNWQASDDQRDALFAKGIAIRDTSGGPIWSYDS